MKRNFGKVTHGHRRDTESFHARLRDECLTTHRFRNMEEAQRLIDDWVKDYNNERPHSSLKDEVPAKIWKEFQIDLDHLLEGG